MSISALYPPSPKNKINPRDLSYYEERGYLAQRKFNGSRNLIYISSDKDVKCFGRHGSSHSRFQMSNNLKEEILSSLDLIDGQEYWLDSELMNKTKSDCYRNKIILFDVLQAGQYFVFSEKYSYDILTITPIYILLNRILHSNCFVVGVHNYN